MLSTLVFFLFFKADAFACPVCFSAKEDTRLFYYLTTVGLIGSVVAIVVAWSLWLRRYVQQDDNRWNHDGK